ncbi:hypothetical protein D3C84_539650 [compost metagenome]
MAGTLTLVTVGATPSTWMSFWPAMEFAPPTVGRVRMASSLPALLMVAPFRARAPVDWKSRSALTSPACTV